MAFEVVCCLTFGFIQHLKMSHLLDDSRQLVFDHKTAVVEFLRNIFGKLIFMMRSDGSDAEWAAVAYFHPSCQAVFAKGFVAAVNNFWVIGRHKANSTLH